MLIRHREVITWEKKRKHLSSLLSRAALWEGSGEPGICHLPLVSLSVLLTL